MGIPATGEVVLVPFPFSDLSQTKVRPAVCIADADRGDWVLCQITSNAYGDPAAIILENRDFTAGGLLVTSYVRPRKLFTANEDVILKSLGQLAPTSFHSIVSAIIRILQPTAIP